MLMVRTAHGVCSACMHEMTCAHPRDLEHPPLECAEFEIAVRPADPVDGSACTDGHEAAALGAELPAGIKGLCVNCEERASCAYPKPEGGVWRCEEYR
jgi:hypothetical protein